MAKQKDSGLSEESGINIFIENREITNGRRYYQGR
jgi:hypothetical protein